MPRRASIVVSLLAAAAGVGVLVHLFATTDLASRVGTLPPAVLLGVPAFAIAAALDTVSWVWAFPREARDVRPSFAALFVIRLAGEAINNALASAYVAGEPVKGLLASRHGPRPAIGLASALVGKTTTVLGEVLFLLLGVAVARAVLPRDHPIVSLLLPIAGVGLGVVLVGILFQTRRVFGRGTRLLRALRLGPRRVYDRALPAADAIDDAVRGYYRHQRTDFLVSTLFGFLGWVAGAFEVWLFLRLATPAEDPLALAVVVEAAVAVVKGLSFFVPASVGAQEGGIAWLFGALGLGVETGLLYALLRRAREVVWIGIGFVALGVLVRRPARAPVGAEAGLSAEAGPG